MRIYVRQHNVFGNVFSFDAPKYDYIVLETEAELGYHVHHVSNRAVHIGLPMNPAVTVTESFARRL